MPIGQIDLFLCLRTQQVFESMYRTVTDAIANYGIEDGELVLADPLPRIPAFVVPKVKSPRYRKPRAEKITYPVAQSDLKLLQASWHACLEATRQYLQELLAEGVEEGELALAEPLPDIPTFFVPRAGQAAATCNS